MEQRALDRRNLSLLILAHMMTDLNQGAVPALIPFLVAQQGLNYFGASGITVAGTLISSILQPLVGFLSDRRSLSWLLVFGPALAGLGLSLSGNLPSYGLVLLAILTSAIGVAIFHPEAYRYANYYSGSRTATGMGIFSVGGTLGYSMGPLLLTFLVVKGGLSATAWMCLPTLSVAFYYFFQQGRLRSIRLEQQQSPQQSGKTDWQAMSLLLSVIVLRSMSYYALSTFVPLYLINQRGFSTPLANSALTVMSIGSVVGALLSGPIADRIGRRRVLFWMALIISAAVLAFVFSPSLLSFGILGLASAALSASFTISMVLGQAYGRGNLGLASGLTVGLAVGVGGLSAPLFGFLADRIGLVTTLASVAVLPLMAAGLILALPQEAL
ncbi:MAG: MFS transporter [Anaerolineae bacterium]|jgi:FSR family fosmidomycin resistance protein-like MFS transporter|nr:MAG: MFS transporter [Anaerolineae bacterium]